MLIWCLKQFKDFILKFSISGTFLSQKAFLNLHNVILVSVVSNWANYHGYKNDVYSHQYYTQTTIIFMNYKDLYQITKTVFNICICLNHCCSCEHNQRCKVWRKAKRLKIVLLLDYPFYKEMWVFLSFVDYI